MGTVKTIGDSTRLKIRDLTPRYFLDSDLLSLINDILEVVYQDMVNISSNFVYGTGQVTTAADTIEYALSFDHNGFLRNGSWVEGEDVFMQQCNEADKIKFDYTSSTSQPEFFYLTEDGKIGYLYVPNDEYTINHQYWKPLVALTDYASDNIPWLGIWNQFVRKMLIVEALEVSNVANDRQRFLAELEHQRAMNLVFNHGVKRERVSSDMFSIQGI